MMISKKKYYGKSRVSVCFFFREIDQSKIICILLFFPHLHKWMWYNHLFWHHVFDVALLSLSISLSVSLYVMWYWCTVDDDRQTCGRLCACAVVCTAYTFSSMISMCRVYAWAYNHTHTLMCMQQINKPAH